jgi:hypothetical protein
LNPDYVLFFEDAGDLDEPFTRPLIDPALVQLSEPSIDRIEGSEIVVVE